MHSFLLPPVLPEKPISQAFYLPPGQNNSSRLHRYTNKHILNFRSLTNNYANLRGPYNQGINVQVTTKDIKKGERA